MVLKNIIAVWSQIKFEHGMPMDTILIINNIFHYFLFLWRGYAWMDCYGNGMETSGEKKKFKWKNHEEDSEIFFFPIRGGTEHES